MAGRVFLIALGLLLAVGCAHSKPICTPVNHAIAPFERYVASNIDWSSIQRVVLMPIANQSIYPKVVYELQTNLAAEIQRAGRFEVVVATRQDQAVNARDLFASGQFDELELLRIAHEYQADAVLFVNVTNYHPYARPRLGLSLLLIHPNEGIAIASINGLWDTREAGTSFQAQAYFRQTQNWPRSLIGLDRVFESPDVFQRFVTQQVAVALSPTPPTASNGMPIPMSPPAGPVMPANASMPDEMTLPSSPPASAEMPQ